MPPISSQTTRPTRLAATLLALVLALLVWSAIRPHDYETWALEVFPALGGIAILAATYRRFPLTPLAYTLIAIHAAILIVGGHYTYALVPAGEWLKDALHLQRNHYDRLGHFIQGFTPAIIAREVLLRHKVIADATVTRGMSARARRLWLAFLVFAICMCISALYELVEWAVAVVTGGSAASTAFLGTQGDPWDTQEDMAMCGIGALAALLALSKIHDSQLRKMATAL